MNGNETILECLSPKIKDKISQDHFPDEIRIRKNGKVCFTYGNFNAVTDISVDENEIEECLRKICKNSVHSYSDTIKNGYIPFENGIRVGVCGVAVSENGKLINIKNINSINIRLQSKEISIPDNILKYNELCKGLLIFSPPDCGKTTLLRHLIKYLSEPPYNKRICVIDRKNELYSEAMHSNSNVDFLTNYPQKTGFDIAIRNLSPQIVICDEIGLCDETESILECKNCGVEVICSAHAGNINELLDRENIKKLHNHKIFSGYIQIGNIKGKRKYDYFKRKDFE